MTAPVREPVATGPSSPPTDGDLRPVEAALERFFAGPAGYEAGEDHRDLWRALEDAADGGKRLRPLLFHSVYLALGGRQTEVAAEVAAALELLHTALVVHDDVIDGDDVRRGRPNVSGTFASDARRRGHDAERSARYGSAAAILAGDLALAGAVRTLALCGAPPATVARLLDHLDRALHLTAAGELTDVRLSMDGAADLTATIAMEDRKTAVYSFELPLLLAATLAEQETRYGPALTRYARLLGVAYQLRDDLDGTFGDETVTGKSALSDLREGKCTPLVAHARTTGHWPQIRPLIGDGDVEAAARVRDLLEQCGARAFVENLATELAEEARRAVADLPISELLDDWVRTVIHREPR